MFTRQHPWVTGASLAIVAGWVVAAGAQRPQTTLPLDPPRERGASITPAYEGWYPNPDGSFSMLIGYYNRNTKEALDIPVGPNNRVEPGGPDQGQPTLFRDRPAVGRVRRSRCRRTSATKAVTWTIVVERRDAVDSVHAEQGLSDHPVQGARDGQRAAGARLFSKAARR